MEEFLDKLYSNEYFGFYLIIAIVVLIILFLVVLFFGKKDQKKREIEANKKLQQINEDAFKEEQNDIKLEVNNDDTNVLGDTIVIPSIEETPVLNNVSENEIPEPIIPTISEENTIMENEKSAEIEPEITPIEIPAYETPVVDVEVPVVDEEIIKEEAVKIIEPIIEADDMPLLDKIEEKPLVFEDTTKFGNDFINEVLEEPKLENEEEPKLEIPEIEVPVFNFDEIVKDVEEVSKTDNVVPNYSKGPQIFSSVYVPEKKEEIVEQKIEIPVEKTIEIPVEKTIETPVEKATHQSNDNLDFELPSLKKEKTELPEKIEMPILTDYNLDELSGETYTIK